MSVSNLYQPLQNALRKHTRLTFADYLEIALYHPDFGYYARQDQVVFGEGGDFVTAPHISPILAQAIASWLTSQGYTEVLEIGPGDGLLARQIIDIMPQVDRYYLLDINQARSQEILGREAIFQWVSEVPSGYSGAIIANEWLDALPFRRFYWERMGGLREVLLHLENDEPCLTLSGSQHSAALQVVRDFSPLWGESYLFEQGFEYDKALSFLNHTTGPVLLIDYGYESDVYYHSDRKMGTMICFQNHQVVDFSLKKTGKMDVTCAVNWTEVMQQAEIFGYQVDNFGPQSDFLRFFAERYLLDKHASVLFEPHEMGEYVKVLALSKT